MKYLIFSDSHLTPHFDKRKFNVLKEAIEKADKVIINGDFWEGYVYSFDAVVNSQWSTTLFPLLKKKKAVYVYGNHDTKDMSDDRVKLFSDTHTGQFSFKSGNKTFHCEHGNRIAPLLDETRGIKYGFIIKWINHIQNAVVALLGPHPFFIINRKGNGQYKTYAKKLKKDEVLVVGHTNSAEVDLSNNYVNNGFCTNGVCQYVFIENGTVSAVTKRY